MRAGRRSESLSAHSLVRPRSSRVARGRAPRSSPQSGRSRAAWGGWAGFPGIGETHRDLPLRFGARGVGRAGLCGHRNAGVRPMREGSADGTPSRRGRRIDVDRWQEPSRSSRSHLPTVRGRPAMLISTSDSRGVVSRGTFPQRRAVAENLRPAPKHLASGLRGDGWRVLRTLVRDHHSTVHHQLLPKL